jgi:pimeloyl-ACP methyl ester carboxylesterase
MTKETVIRTALLALFLITSDCNAQSSIGGAPSSEVALVNAKRGKIKATYYPAPAPKALILLFHQAGANRSEYNDIVPRLVQSGYSALNVDQRGGGLLGSMIDGKPDMEAALAWAQGKAVPVIIWGSSYSASIVYMLAAEQPEKIKAALVFSGGDYLGGGRVLSAARKVSIPIFATSSPDEVAEMKSILDLAPSARKTFFIPKRGGVHGSGTLSPQQNPKGAEENWAAVLAFLAGVVAN